MMKIIHCDDDDDDIDMYIVMMKITKAMFMVMVTMLVIVTFDPAYGIVTTRNHGMHAELNCSCIN